MQDNSNGTESTIYLVTFERAEAADVAVRVPGPPSDEARDEAVRGAERLRGAGLALAWACVGEPYVASAEPVDESRETAGAVA